MEFYELLAAFASKYGIKGHDGAAEFDVDGFRVELLDAPQSLEAKNADELFGMANNPGITGRSRRRRRE